LQTFTNQRGAHCKHIQSECYLRKLILNLEGNKVNEENDIDTPSQGWVGTSWQLIGVP